MNVSNSLFVMTASILPVNLVSLHFDKKKKLNCEFAVLSLHPTPYMTGTMALCRTEIGVDGKADLRYTGGPKPMVLSQALCTSLTQPRPLRYRTDQRMNE